MSCFDFNFKFEYPRGTRFLLERERKLWKLADALNNVACIYNKVINQNE